MLNSNCLSPLDKQMWLCKMSLKNLLETAPLLEISGISCFYLDHRLWMLQRHYFILSFVLLIYFWPEPRFLGFWGTGSKSWWESSGRHCGTVVLPPDVHTFSMHLGTQSDASTSAPRVQSKELSIYPWQTDFLFRSMNVLVLCEYAGVIRTKPEVDKWQWEKFPPKCS